MQKPVISIEGATIFSFRVCECVRAFFNFILKVKNLCPKNQKVQAPSLS